MITNPFKKSYTPFPLDESVRKAVNAAMVEDMTNNIQRALQLNPDLWIKEDPFQIIDTYMSSSKSRKMLEKWINPQVFENWSLIPIIRIQ